MIKYVERGKCTVLYFMRINAAIKHLKGEIWELRPLRNRILYAYYENDTFIILHHFIKTTNKTPKQELEQAKRNLEEYRERNGK